jgi:hypothetical protein
MDDAAQMEGNPVRGFGRPQCGLLWLEALGEVSQSSGEGLGDQQLVEPSTEAWHAGILCSSDERPSAGCTCFCRLESFSIF